MTPFGKLKNSLSNVKQAFGTPDATLLTTGTPAWALIEDVQLGTMTMSVGVDTFRVCTFVVQVRLDGEQPYQASVRQRVHELQVARLPIGVPICARVDPADRSRVVLDWDTPAPTVTVPPRTDGLGAAQVLATGAPCTVVVVQHAPIGLRSADGHPMHSLRLTVVPEQGSPYETQVGQAVPPAALPGLYPGAHLPARVHPVDPQVVAVDWHSVSMATSR